jgi:multidrug transporter EmrE-like cation transporter
MCDFKGIYYDVRCLLQHSDPYKPGEPLRVYLADGAGHSMTPPGTRGILMGNIYLPTAFIFLAPFAMLPCEIAYLLWLILTAVALSLAAFLIWDSGANYAPRISAGLICFALANLEILFATGNPGGIAVSLCVVAAWCFLKDRFALAGVLCLTISLAIKPHDAGLVWLYFLLAGGVPRKRALQTLLVTSVVSLATILWITPIAPHWPQELHSNLSIQSASGGLNEGNPASVDGRPVTTAIDLRVLLSVFWNDPRIYTLGSYLVCAPLLLLWVFRTVRSRFSQRVAWLALAAIAPLTMLVTYHRPYDAKLMLLAVPVCAMLWARGGTMRWIALLVTSAGFVFTADIPLTILRIFTDNLNISTAGLSGKILTVVLMRPAPLVLLAMGLFYLWIYVRRDPARDVYSAI